MRPPTGNAISQGQHGTSKAVDYRAVPDATIYAPEDGVIDSYQQRGSGVNDAGNALRLRGATGLHQFAHLERSLVSVGQRVSKGQPIAIMGYTGYTIPSGPGGRHLHYWVQTPSGYVYPPNLYKEPFNAPQGGNVLDLGQARVLAFHVLGRNGKDGTPNALAGEADGDLNKNHVGKNLSSKLWEFYNSPEAENWRGNRLQVVYAQRNNYKTQLDQVTADRNQLITKYDARGKEIEELKKQLAQSGGGISNEDSAAIKETLSIVRWIKDQWIKIFK